MFSFISTDFIASPDRKPHALIFTQKLYEGSHRLAPKTQISLLTALLLLVVALLPISIKAQGVAPILRGSTGLTSGSQAPPGIYYSGLVYFYDTHEIVDKDGNKFNRVSVKQGFTAGGVTYVAKKKIFGGNYSATLLAPLVNARLTTPLAADVPTGVGYSDTYAQPIQLGWHGKRWDALTGYGIYIPTGKFQAGSTNNKGLGMWSHEISGGTTLFLDEKRTWHVATNAYYNIQSHQRGTTKTVGNILSLDGGFGRALCSHLCNLGVDYFAQWKVTADKGSNLPPPFNAKDRYYGLGPEVNSTIPINANTIFAFKLAYYQEVGNRVATQGNVFLMSMTIGRLHH